MCANLIIAVSHFCPLSCWCYATVREFSLHYVCQERNFAQKSSWIQQSCNKIKRLNSFIFMRIRQCFPDSFVIYISNYIEFQTKSGGNKTNVFSHSITKTCCGWISDFKIKYYPTLVYKTLKSDPYNGNVHRSWNLLTHVNIAFGFRCL